jgi:hypothetical protein
MGGGYYAGLCGLDFRRSLLWKVNDPFTSLPKPELHARRPDPPRAPSWSWASIATNGYIQNPVQECLTRRKAKTCIIEDVSVKPIGSAGPRGAEQGAVRVRGYLGSILVAPPRGEHESYRESCFHSAANPEVRDPETGKWMGTFWPDLRHEYIGGSENEPTQTVFCLPIWGFEKAGDDADSSDESGD